MHPSLSHPAKDIRWAGVNKGVTEKEHGPYRIMGSHNGGASAPGVSELGVR
jgi:hypothetical protein